MNTDQKATAMSAGEKAYYFACDSLWGALSLLTEEAAVEENSEFASRWRSQYAKVTNWALTEKLFAAERFSEIEPKEFLQSAEEASDKLMARWDRSLREAAHSAHETYPDLSESVWLYFYCCRFLWRVLGEFERLVDGLTPYAQRYREVKPLFDDLAVTLGNEQALPGFRTPSDEALAGRFLADVDAYATRLGQEWRDGVFSAIQEL